MKNGLCGQHFPYDTIIAAVRKWVASSGADFMSEADRLLFTAGEN
jgi:hypothetical protein